MTNPGSQSGLDSQMLGSLMHSVDELKAAIGRIDVHIATLTERVGGSVTERAETKARITALETTVAAMQVKMADHETVKRIVYGLVLALIAAIGTAMWSSIIGK